MHFTTRIYTCLQSLNSNLNGLLFNASSGTITLTGLTIFPCDGYVSYGANGAGGYVVGNIITSNDVNIPYSANYDLTGPLLFDVFVKKGMKITIDGAIYATVTFTPLDMAQ